MLNIYSIIQRLQQKNEKAYYLAALRVLLSLWLLKELLLRWPAFEVLYSNNSFLDIKPVGLHFFLPWIQLVKANYLLFMYGLILLLLLNITGAGRNLVSFLIFVALGTLQMINYKFVNGGDIMALLLSLYLSAANTFSFFTPGKRKPFSEKKERLYNLLSNLVVYSIMINLAFIYLMSGIGKLEDPYWRNGTAIHYLLNTENYFVFASEERPLELPKIILYTLSYGVIILELLAPFLIWYKKYRFPVFACLFLMHLFIYCFFMFYGMSVIFVLQYGLFFSEAEIKGALQKLKNILPFRLRKRQN
ncbi:MAG: HTTM domain-containing protein [Ferruginibacter sp.]